MKNIALDAIAMLPIRIGPNESRDQSDPEVYPVAGRGSAAVKDRSEPPTSTSLMAMLPWNVPA